MKKGDIVKFRIGITDEMQKGKVNWVKDDNVGITLIGDKYSGVEATVMPVNDCEVVIEYKGDDLRAKIHDLKTEELIASIHRLKGMRLPKQAKRRAKHSSTPRSSQKQKLTKLLEVLDGDPNALDDLIDKALGEEKE